MHKFLTAIIIFVSISCRQAKLYYTTKILDFGSFSIETPQSWTKIKIEGVDSYVGRIAIDNNDTLEFDLGFYSNSLYEYDPIILDSSMVDSIDTSAMNKDEIIFVKARKAVDPDRYRKNNVIWQTIDGHNAKIVYPRKSGIGTTGIYIDSLLVSGPDVDRFNLYGINLTPENERKVLQALRTLKFQKK